MVNYNIDAKYRYVVKTITKGTQEKYLKDGIYYKVDRCGNEGLVEYLASVVLQCSTLSKEEFVEYTRCYINSKPGCYSADFLNANEEFVTVNRLYASISGRDNLADKLCTFNPGKERLDYLLDLVCNFGVDRDIYRLYLNKLVQLDYLICNTDRHVHNFGLIVGNSCRIPPIFDNGHALHTVPDEDDVSCTISGSFETQLTAFSFPYKPVFSINYKKFITKMQQEPDIMQTKEFKFLDNKLKTCDFVANTPMKELKI